MLINEYYKKIMNNSDKYKYFFMGFMIKMVEISKNTNIILTVIILQIF